MTQTYSEQVAATIRAEVARHRITHLQIAERLDVTQATVSRKLSGKQAFTLNEVAAVADLLGLPVGALYGEQAAAS